jgi:hypothetical protein
MVDSNNESSFEQSLPEYKQGIEPVQSLVESHKILDKLPVIGKALGRRGILSARSKIKVPTESGVQLGESRTLADRRLRRELMDEVHATPVELSTEQAERVKELRQAEGSTSDEEEKNRIRLVMQSILAEKNAPRREIVKRGHERDAMSEKFITDQQEVRVDMGELGEQMSRAIVLPSPDQEAARQKPPIFLITGISNDLENMGILPQEMASEGRNVIMIAFPEAWRGEITEEFKNATEAAETYEPHVAFFKKAIEKLKSDPKVREQIGDFDKFDMWGHSEGSVIVAESLTDPEYRQQVANAAIICPPNCVELSTRGLIWGLITEQWNALRPKRFKDAPKRNVINRETVIVDKEMRARKQKTYEALVAKSRKRTEWWNRDMQVSDGGKITVVSYDSDRMTKSYKAVPEIRQNPRLNVVELSGSPETDLVQPKPLIEALK